MAVAIENELFKAIRTTCGNAAALLALVPLANIRQGRQPITRSLPAVSMQIWTDVEANIDQAVGIVLPREITVLFSIFTADDSSATYAGSTLLYEIANQLIAALNGVDISTATLHSITANYDGWQSPPYYDDTTREWQLDTRFRFIVAAV